MRTASFLTAVFAFLMLLDIAAFSQDLLVRISRDTLRVKIVEVGRDNILFRRSGGTKKDPVYEIYKNLVKEIIFENGKHVTILYDIKHVNPKLSVREKKNAITVDVAAPLLNHFTFGYERSIFPGKNLEIKGGIIGLRTTKSLDHAKGFLIKGGLKFIFLTEQIQSGLTYVPPLPGIYVKPEIMYSKYTTESEKGKIDYENFALAIIFGKAFAPGKFLTIDFYGGIGVGKQNSSYEQSSIYDRSADEYSYAYTHIFLGNKIPIILCGGLTVGVAF